MLRGRGCRIRASGVRYYVANKYIIGLGRISRVGSIQGWVHDIESRLRCSRELRRAAILARYYNVITKSHTDVLPPYQSSTILPALLPRVRNAVCYIDEQNAWIIRNNVLKRRIVKNDAHAINCG